MPIIRLKEIAGMSIDDRAAKLYDLRAELARIETMINAGGRVDNASRVRELRKTIAQILTITKRRKLGYTQSTANNQQRKKNQQKRHLKQNLRSKLLNESNP